MPKPQRGGREGRGGGGGGGNRDVTVSKALSLLLRHAAEREGLKMDSQGYARVADVLAWRKLKSLQVTFPEIVHAVESSDKKRFALLHIPSESTTDPASHSTDEPELQGEAEAEEDAKKNNSANTTATALAAAHTDLDPTNYLIRATQGHSIKSVEADSLLEKLTLNDDPPTTTTTTTTTFLPDTVVHGTFHGAWPRILASGGLRCMGRNHVHFATGPSVDSVLADLSASAAAESQGKGKGKEKTVISGMRHDAQVLIYINLRRALAAGCPFWRSENGVILSEGVEVDGVEGKVVPVEFFEVVVERKKGLGKIWEEGEVLQTLSEELTGRGTPKERGRGRGRGGGHGHNQKHT